MKTKAETLKALTSHIADNCKPVDREAAFDAMLDDCYTFEKVGGPFAHMSPSRVLRECDPVGHRCGVNDYADGEEWTEIGSETYETEAAEIARTEFVGELETEADELQREVDEIDDMPEGDQLKNTVEGEKLRADLATLRENINAAVRADLYSL
jgi:D-serine deaminase-like pyridoxal phosphate-dependent protein